MNKKVYYTWKMTRMLPHIRGQILEVMVNPANDGCSQAEIAELVGVHKRTLGNYLTDELWEEIKRQRILVVDDETTLLDKSILKRALKGDIAAAKLMYSRWDKVKVEGNEKVGIAAVLAELDDG